MSSTSTFWSWRAPSDVSVVGAIVIVAILHSIKSVKCFQARSVEDDRFSKAGRRIGISATCLAGGRLERSLVYHMSSNWNIGPVIIDENLPFSGIWQQ